MESETLAKLSCQQKYWGLSERYDTLTAHTETIGLSCRSGMPQGMFEPGVSVDLPVFLLG